jgi:hypothetical protein
MFTAGYWNEAASKLSDLVNDESFQSLAGKTKHQLWLELCDIITKHPADVQSMPVDAILRGGIRKFTDEVGDTNHVIHVGPWVASWSRLYFGLELD